MVPSPRVTSQSFWESWRQWRTAPNQRTNEPTACESRIPAVTLVSLVITRNHSRNPRHSIWNFNFWGHRSYVEDSGQEAFEFFRPQNHWCLWCFKCQKFQALLGFTFHRWFHKGLDKVTTITPYYTRPCHHVRLVHISPIISFISIHISEVFEVFWCKRARWSPSSWSTMGI